MQIEDIVESVRMIEHHKGKYIKIVLADLEQRDCFDKNVRKVVLDAFNNFSRAVQRELGYNVED